MCERTFILHRGEGEVPKESLIARRDFFPGPDNRLHAVQIEIFKRCFLQQAAVMISFERYGAPLPHEGNTLIRVRAVSHRIAEAMNNINT